MSTPRANDRPQRIQRRLSQCATWQVTATVTDYGQWDPTDAAQAAALISAVNALRGPNDPKPRVEWYRSRANLTVRLGTTSVFLAPGEHLVRTEAPRAAYWQGMPDDELDELRPAVDGGDD